jgi:16S rRNA (guanine(966)-N(2))-methyltransferase RsmD
LKARKGLATRPTSDRVREAIFNILLARGPAPERVLDLYAGTGALGLEALSRGSSRAVFVDVEREACELIRENARALGFEAACAVEQKRVLDYRPSGRFGWIFLDPPYAAGELGRVLSRLGDALSADGVVVAEHDWRRPPDEPHGGLALQEVRRYGQTAVSIFLRRENA